MKRCLTLRTEHLAELTSDELGSVAGGTVTNRTCTGIYPSINYPCTTPVTDAIQGTVVCL
jgi:hypothetical protein